jgi:hypothetical protein
MQLAHEKWSTERHKPQIASRTSLEDAVKLFGWREGRSGVTLLTLWCLTFLNLSFASLAENRSFT